MLTNILYIPKPYQTSGYSLHYSDYRLSPKGMNTELPVTDQ